MITSNQSGIAIVNCYTLSHNEKPPKIKGVKNLKNRG